MSGNSSRTSVDNEPKSRSGWILGIIIVLLIAAFFIFQKHDHDDHAGHDHEPGKHGEHGERRGLAPNQVAKVARPGDPVGDYDYLFDKAPGANLFLLSKTLSKNFIPESDAPAGRDLWIQDENGKERLLAEDVYRAKFSPDGKKIAYTTADCVMHIEDLTGKKIGEVQRAYEPNWSSDSSSIVYAAVPDGRHVHIPEVLGLSLYDVNSGTIKQITDGRWDDVRPHFDPTDERILFVSGARSGLASIWVVDADGGAPRQLTNRGMEQINELFVPTPYDRTFWSPDGKYLVYDFKNGDQHEIWAVEYPSGKGKKLGEGLDPRIGKNGEIIAVRQNGGRAESVQYALP